MSFSSGWVRKARVSTRPSRSPNLRTASSPRLAPESAARRTSRSPCSALKRRRCSPGDCGFASSACVAISTLSPADRKICRTSLSVWCRRGSGRAGPRMPANGFDRRTPSLTAQDRAERRTSQREDTVDTDTSRMNRIETDDHPDLPHAWKSFADGARASLRSVDRHRHIPITGGYPYSCRDFYRDDEVTEPSDSGRLMPLTRIFAWRARQDSNLQPSDP